MFGFLRPISERRESGAIAPAEGRPLCFDPQRAAQAIRFHLLDSKAASAVDNQSYQATIARLTQRAEPLSIRRDRWATMSDAERLHWLLDRSRTSISFGPHGVAVLLGPI